MKYEHFFYKGYGCDDDGTTYSTKGKRRVVIHHTGYQVIGVRRDSKTIQYRAHRFIMECITGRAIPENMLVNHIDGNKSNNQIDNLEIVTSSENTQHAFRTGLISPMVGELNGNARIDANTVRQIIRDCMLGMHNTELGLKYTLDPKDISLIRYKKRWKFIFDELEFTNYDPKKSKYIGKNVQRLSKAS